MGELPKEESRALVNQHFHGRVGSVTGSGDIVHHHSGSIQLIHVLAQAVQDAPQIPEPEKKNLLQKLRLLAEEPYISGLATSAIYEGIKGLVEQLSK